MSAKRGAIEVSVRVPRWWPLVGWLARVGLLDVDGAARLITARTRWKVAGGPGRWRAFRRWRDLRLRVNRR